MCQRDNNPNKKQETAKDHQWGFNTAENPASRD